MGKKWEQMGVKTGKFNATDPEEQKKIVASLLKHNGTALIIRSLDNICKVKLLEYDKAVLNGDMNKAREIAVFRHVCLDILPDVIERIMNERSEAPRRLWKWRFKTWVKKVFRRRR